MKIRMKTLMCGPTANYAPGQVWDAPEDLGRDLVAGGYAEAVEQKAAPKPENKAAPVAENKASQAPDTKEEPEAKRASAKWGRRAK